MDNKALQLLGICRKAGKIAAGEEPVGTEVRAGHARLILVAHDAADRTFRRARSFSETGKCAFIRVPFTREEMGAVLGRQTCALAAITDVCLAQSFVRALGQPEKYADLQADLDRRADRVAQRRREEQIHRKKLQHHGKKS